MRLSYGDIIATLSLLVEGAILYYVIKEFRHATRDVVKEFQNVSKGVQEFIVAPTRTVYGTTDDLNVGDRVFVLEPQPNVPRDQWQYSQTVYVVREVDRIRNRALATPVLAPPQGPTPTVDGPLRGPLSPFKKAFVSG
jgi:hypothetical protein